MSVALATRGLGKRYGRRWALSGCTLEVPDGHVAGLVGPNGAGKTTLLHLAVGLIEPSGGSIAVLGEEVAATPAQLARVGFVGQEAPLYPSLSVADHLRLGAALNPGWDAALAQARIARLGLDRAQRAGTLSGGQRAQLALTLAIAKRPALCLAWTQSVTRVAGCRSGSRSSAWPRSPSQASRAGSSAGGSRRSTPST